MEVESQARRQGTARVVARRVGQYLSPHRSPRLGDYPVGGAVTVEEFVADFVSRMRPLDQEQLDLLESLARTDPELPSRQQFQQAA